MASNDIVVKTDEIEMTFDTDAKNLTVTDFEQAEQLADNIIHQTQERKDPYYALEALRQMDRLRDLVGIAKAKVLHFLNKYWAEFQINSPFIETIVAYSGLTSAEVIKRYIKIWDMFDKNLVPPEYAEEIKSKRINDLTPIMGAISAGYEITNEQWKNIAGCKNHSEVTRYVRTNVKGMEESSHAIYFAIDKTGTLYATTGGERYYIGRLSLRGQEEPAKRAITRIIETMNIEVVNEEIDDES